MSRTARKQGPEGPTPALHGYSSTFVRVCQAPVFESEAGSHGTRLFGAAWLPWRVLPILEGAPAPALDYLRPAPRYRNRAEPTGDRNTQPPPPPALRPPFPQRGKGAGRKGGEPQASTAAATEAPSPMGPGGGRTGGEQGRRTAQPGAGAPPHRRPAPTAPPGTSLSEGPGSAGGGEGRREPGTIKRDHATLRRAARGAARRTAGRAARAQGGRPYGRPPQWPTTRRYHSGAGGRSWRGPRRARSGGP